MQNKYKQIQTCLMPIYSEDDNIIGVIGLDVSSDSMNFNKEDDISTTLFDNNGNIIYCNTDIEIIGENFTNLYHPYDKIIQKSKLNHNFIIYFQQLHQLCSLHLNFLDNQYMAYIVQLSDITFLYHFLH